ncbi:sigma-70 family RNA polymerase sigma factor [Clostridium carnis]
MNNLHEVLTLAKAGNSTAKEELINLYYPLILKEAKKIYLRERTFDDLIQIGITNLLMAINKFDMNKGISAFSSYVQWTMINNFRYLCRGEIRYNSECSLNAPSPTGEDLGHSILDNVDVENSVLQDMLIERLNVALKTLSVEEQEIITYLYYSNTKTNLSKYCRDTGKDYYTCCNIKKSALRKLKISLL